MKNRLWVYFSFALVLLCFVMVETYGLFETNSSGTGGFSIGKWVIVLNNEDISLERSITLDDFIYEENSHIESGFFAPGGVAYLDLIIDASNTDVSLEYEISFDDSEFDSHPNIGLSFTDLQTNQVIVGDTYSGTISVSAQNKIIRLRLNLEWDDNSSYDDADTELIDGTLSCLVNVNFTQLIEE